jgi:hypothetical protein
LWRRAAWGNRFLLWRPDGDAIRRALKRNRRSGSVSSGADESARIEASDSTVQIHHGTADGAVSVKESQNTESILKAQRTPVETVYV